MTDRELLEAAAKAAGVVGQYARTHQTYGDEWVDGLYTGAPIYWNPLTDDGDALRLAVALRLHIGLESHAVSVWQADQYGRFTSESIPDLADPRAATRRAIVRAAASCSTHHV